MSEKGKISLEDYAEWNLVRNNNHKRAKHNKHRLNKKCRSLEEYADWNYNKKLDEDEDLKEND